METSRKSNFEMLEDVSEFKAFKNIEEMLYKEHGIKVSSSNKIDAFKEIVNICLDTKIGVNLSESNYSVLLQFVLNQLDRETFRSLLKKITSSNNNVLNNIINNDVKNPLLHSLLDGGKYNLVQDLLEFGADVNVKDLRQETLLFCAVRSKEYEVIEMITKAGCDVNVRNKEGLLAINYIFNIRIWESDKSKKKIPYIEIINLLCSHGNNLDFNNEGGSRMLYDACKLGLFNEVQFLLKFGANMFFVSSYGDTMLHAAAQGHNLKLVEFLLNNGLNINAKNNNNETPLCKLISYNYAFDKVKSSEGIKRDMDIIEFLADNGADVNAFTNDLVTPLEESIVLNVPEIMECLLDLNAYIDVLENFIKIQYADFFSKKSPSEVDKIQIDELLIIFLSTKIDISHYSNKTTKERFEWMMSMYEKCKLEMNRMKAAEICKNNNVSYMDFLLKDLIKVAKFCRNENITLALETEFYKKEFPLYKFFIEKRFRRAQLLKHYMEVTTRFLNEFFGNNLTTVIADIIFSFLEVADIRNFGRALYA